MFRFVKQPEHIRVGCRLLFRQGVTKGMGEVIKVYSIFDSESSASGSDNDNGMPMDVQDR